MKKMKNGLWVLGIVLACIVSLMVMFRMTLDLMIRIIAL